MIENNDFEKNTKNEDFSSKMKIFFKNEDFLQNPRMKIFFEMIR